MRQGDSKNWLDITIKAVTPLFKNKILYNVRHYHHLGLNGTLKNLCDKWLFIYWLIMNHVDVWVANSFRLIEERPKSNPIILIHKSSHSTERLLLNISVIMYSCTTILNFVRTHKT